MNLRAFYEKVGGNFDSILERLLKEDRIEKYVYKFLDDKTFKVLSNSIDSNNYEEAFRAAHTLKGLCQNLDLLTLYSSASEITETLRYGVMEGVDYGALLESVRVDYEMTCDAIRELRS